MFFYFRLYYTPVHPNPSINSTPCLVRLSSVVIHLNTSANTGTQLWVDTVQPICATPTGLPQRGLWYQICFWLVGEHGEASTMATASSPSHSSCRQPEQVEASQPSPEHLAGCQPSLSGRMPAITQEKQAIHFCGRLASPQQLAGSQSSSTGRKPAHITGEAGYPLCGRLASPLHLARGQLQG